MQNGYLQPSDFSGAGDDSDISDILGLGQNASQQDRLALQMKLANALRTNQAAQGTSVPQGSTFLPNTLQTAMSTFDHIQGIVAQAQGKKQGDSLDKDRQKGLAHFAKMWFKGQQNPSNAPMGVGSLDDDASDQGPPSPMQTPDDNQG